MKPLNVLTPIFSPLGNPTNSTTPSTTEVPLTTFTAPLIDTLTTEEQQGEIEENPTQELESKTEQEENPSIARNDDRHFDPFAYQRLTGIYHQMRSLGRPSRLSTSSATVLQEWNAALKTIQYQLWNMMIIAKEGRAATLDEKRMIHAIVTNLKNEVYSDKPRSDYFPVQINKGSSIPMGSRWSANPWVLKQHRKKVHTEDS